MNVNEEKIFRALNRGFLRLSRWLLLLICLCSGAYLLLEGKSIGFGILLLLIVFWLALDNPLEYFEILEGPCPYCGMQVRVRRRIKVPCPECLSAIVIGSDSRFDQDDTAVSLQTSRVQEEVAGEHPQVELVEISLDDTLDLHTFSPTEVASLLNEFIDLSQKADIKLVRIIHGKGTGALRRRVQGLLARDPRVATYYDAPPKSGGWGVTIVELKPDHGEDGGEAK